MPRSCKTRQKAKPCATYNITAHFSWSSTLRGVPAWLVIEHRMHSAATMACWSTAAFRAPSRCPRCGFLGAPFFRQGHELGGAPPSLSFFHQGCRRGLPLSLSLFLSFGRVRDRGCPLPARRRRPRTLRRAAWRIKACTTEARTFKMNDSVTSNKGRRTQHAIRKPSSSHTWPRVGVLVMAEVGPPKATAKKLGKALGNLLKTNKPEERPGSRPPEYSHEKGANGVLIV